MCVRTFRYPEPRPFIIEWMMSLVRCTLHNIAQLLLSVPQQYIMISYKVESVSLVCNSLDHGKIEMTVYQWMCALLYAFTIFYGATDINTIYSVIFHRLSGTMAICLLPRRHISKWHHRKFTAMHSLKLKWISIIIPTECLRQILTLLRYRLHCAYLW